MCSPIRAPQREPFQEGDWEKVRHIEVNQLRMQEIMQKGNIQVIKISGISNQADILTKHVNGNTLRNHISGLSHVIGNDRHLLMPEMAGT